MLRVAAGALRGLIIDVPPHIRPTEGKVRQAIFNILGPSIAGARVIDAFAGSGALGLEALSRGAGFVAFLESNPACLRAIERNLAQVTTSRQIAPEAVFAQWTVLPGDANRSLEVLAGRGERFDVALLDPPYDGEEGKKALQAVGRSAILAASGILCLEHARSTRLPTTAGSLGLIKQHRYGETVLSFYQGASPGMTAQ